MKRKLYYSLLLIFASVSSYSQWYIKPFYANGFGTFKNWMDFSCDKYTMNSDSSISQVTNIISKQISFGGGNSAGINIGKTFNPYISLELGFKYYFGKHQKYETTENYDYEGYSAYFIHITYDGDFTTRLIQFTPTILFSYPQGKFRPYLRIGPALGYCFINEDIESDYHITLPSYIPFETGKTKRVYERQLTYGLSTVIGFEYSFSNVFSIYLDLDHLTMFYSPNSAEIKEYTFEDKDQLSTLSTNEKEIVFKESAGTDNSTEKDQPAINPKLSFSLCNLSFELGFKINLSNPKK